MKRLLNTFLTVCFLLTSILFVSPMTQMVYAEEKESIQEQTINATESEGILPLEAPAQNTSSESLGQIEEGTLPGDAERMFAAYPYIKVNAYVTVGSTGSMITGRKCIDKL